MDDLKIWGKMQARLEALQAETLLGGMVTNGTPVVAKELTFADIERCVRDIDPDGRRLQEARLLGACQSLTKEQVELVIRFAVTFQEPLPWERTANGQA